MIRLAIAVVVSAAMLFGASSARAEYSLCNRTSYAIAAAIGYAAEDAIETRGWWSLRPGQCRIVLTEKIRAGDYYVYSEAIIGHLGEQRVWSGDVPLCVLEEGFFTHRNQGPCEGPDRSRRRFTVINVDDSAAGEWRTDFTEADEFTNLHVAETAGVQRLLIDLGYDAGDIDGYMGQKTRDAVAEFKRSNGLVDPTVINDELVDTLVERANAQERDRGLFLCNSHNASIWTAIAEKRGEAYASRGWWRLNPDQCAKVIKGGLASEDPYYVFAAAEDEDGERALAGGERPFCINSVMFEIGEDVACTDEGYDEASFMPLGLNGAESYTHRFTSEDFSPPTN